MEKTAKTHVLILITALLVIIGCIIFSFLSPVSRSWQKGERINLLLIGTDNVEENRHSDVIIFVSIHPRDRFVDILSIPRDSRIKVPKYRLLRVNEYFAYGSKKGGVKEGAELLKSVIEGVLHTSIPYYIQLDYEAVVRIVDALGGVTVNITEKMNYDDNWGKLHIHFNPGVQKLNGNDAIRYLRFRMDAQGDIGRMQRQRGFLKALSEKLKSPAMLLRFPKLLYIGWQNVHTNLRFYDMVTLAFEGRKLDMSNFRLQHLPGKPGQVRGAWIWEIDQQKLDRIIDLIHQGVPLPQKKANVRIELWNASGEYEASLETMRYLREKGVDVLSWRYYEVKLPHSKVIDRVGDIETAHYLGDLVGTEEVETALFDSSLAHQVIILGKDWRAYVTK